MFDELERVHAARGPAHADGSSRTVDDLSFDALTDHLARAAQASLQASAFDFARLPVVAGAKASEPSAREAAPEPAPVSSGARASSREPLITSPHEADEVSADHFADTALAAMTGAAHTVNAVPAVGTSPPGVALAAFGPTASALPSAPATTLDIDDELAQDDEQLADASRRREAADGGGEDEAPDTGAMGGTPSDSSASARSYALARAGLGAARSTRPGAPLGSALRAQVEPWLGLDLGRVRIHTDAEAAALADRLQARALTFQSDIYFASGAYEPSRPAGMHLLLHELAHVVQNANAPAREVIARKGFISGGKVHNKLEEILRERHAATNLISEGVLPAGNTAGMDLGSPGYPDLYRSPAGNKVPWVQGTWQPDGTLKYEPLRLVPGRAHPRSKAGKAQHEPTVDKSQTVTGDFPQTFEVAEIKPAGLTRSLLSKVGEGLAQSNNYLQGFPRFAERAKADGKTSVVPKPAFLTKVKDFLPPAIDYNNFKSDAGNTKPATPNLVFGKRRIWVYPQQSSPVLHYFDLPHPYAASDYTKALDQLFAELEGLRRTLGRKQTGPRVKLRSAQGRGGAARAKVARRARARIARKTDWKAEHDVWEKQRADWDTTKAKPYLKTDAASAVSEKADVDRFLKLPASTDPEGAERGRKIRQIELFSGKTGKILGDIRYALAPVFEKIGPFFEWLKTKFNALIGRMKQSKTLSLSWAQTVFDAVMAALQTTFQEAVSLLFEKFQDCIIGMVENFIQGFMRDLTEELEKPFEAAKTAFFEWLGVDEASVGKLITDVEASLKKYEEIIDAVMDVKRLVNEIKVYEWAIRGIVEIISCFSPPLVGCLWGLVAQMALPAIVDLAMTSDLFQDRVVRPLVRDLLTDILDEPFSRIVGFSMDSVGLGGWAKGVPACGVEPLDINKLLDEAIQPGLKLNDPELLKKRAEWNKANEEVIYDEVVKKFIVKDGKPLTPEVLKKLMDQIEDLLPGAGTIQDGIAHARRADGKIDFERFSDWANGKVGAKSQKRGGGGGFSGDKPGVPDGTHVKSTLEGLQLGKASATQLAEILEGSRDEDGNVNVDQFARRITQHIERREIKQNIDAKYPDMPGVAKQSEREFAGEGGAAPSNEEMRELVESLAKANLGDASVREKLKEARRDDGKVDVAALKAKVDAAASGLPSAGGQGPASGAPGQPGEAPDLAPKGEPSEGKAPEKPGEKRPDLTIEKEHSDQGGSLRIGPFDVGPQVIEGPQGSGSVSPGIKFDLPELGDKSKKKP